MGDKVIATHPEPASAQGGDARWHTVHTLRHQLGPRRGEHPPHGVGVGVVEHRAVHYAAAVAAVKGIAGHLAAIDGDVVAPGGRGVDAQRGEHPAYQGGVAAKAALYTAAVCGDVRKHHVVRVGIYAAPARFAPPYLYAMLGGIGHIDLKGYVLMAAAYHRRACLPGKKPLITRGRAHRQPLLGCEVKRQDAPCGGRRYDECFHDGQIYDTLPAIPNFFSHTPPQICVPAANDKPDNILLLPGLLY